MEKKDSLDKVREGIERELIFTCTSNDYEHWFSVLSARIADLIQNDFEKLVVILYRLDVNELRLKLLLKEHPDTNAGNIIAKLIIERQLEKIYTRESFWRDDTGIEENEKW